MPPRTITFQPAKGMDEFIEGLINEGENSGAAVTWSADEFLKKMKPAFITKAAFSW